MKMSKKIGWLVWVGFMSDPGRLQEPGGYASLGRRGEYEHSDYQYGI